jgi:hypothetical protein
MRLWEAFRKYKITTATLVGLCLSILLATGNQPTARYLREPDHFGNNSLVVVNKDTRHDCVLLLYDPTIQRIGVYAYIPRNTEVELSEIPDGNYTVYIQMGTGWSDEYKAFRKPGATSSYFMMNKPIAMTGKSRPALNVRMPAKPSETYRPINREQFLNPIRVCARRLYNGHQFIPDSPYFSGLGKLTIDNQTGKDAVVALCADDSSPPVKAVYVRANSVHTIENIPQGLYTVRFVLGTEWNPNWAEFTIIEYAKVFEQRLNFQEIRQYGSIQYSTFRLTLHEVVGGNAPTEQESPEVIERLLKKR